MNLIVSLTGIARALDVDKATLKYWLQRLGFWQRGPGGRLFQLTFGQLFALTFVAGVRADGSMKPSVAFAVAEHLAELIDEERGEVFLFLRGAGVPFRDAFAAAVDREASIRVPEGIVVHSLKECIAHVRKRVEEDKHQEVGRLTSTDLQLVPA